MTTPKTTAEKNPAQAARTVKDALESLTGYEELAITEAFGDDVYALGGSTRLRALVWLEQRAAEGVSDAQAFAAVMGMRSGDVADSFGDDALDEAEAGKGASTTEEKPPPS